LAGQAATGLLNILASAGVGTIGQIGSKATPSGTPLIPQQMPASLGQMVSPDAAAQAAARAGGGPGGGVMINNIINGGVHTSNLDEWNRRQQRIQAQTEQPITQQYSH
jgi:hypothetical protein